MTLTRRTPLRRTGGPKRTGRLRQRSKRQAARDRILAERRSDLLPAPCAGCGEWADCLHHRRLRSQGGGHCRANLLPLCDRCHGWVHDNPAQARRLGRIVSEGDDGYEALGVDR